MELRYKTALEIILAICEKSSYVRDEDIRLICKTALETDCEDEEDVLS